ncbi:MAG: helix-turn-helix transcriptional regulator [Victivallales bacterium]|nr:helix-turn-helix transcriptional regulator [Victivallales bacterium]
MTALNEVIRARNIKQAVLASKLGISKSAVSMQVKNGIKTIRTANKYGDALKCNPFFLLDA